MLHSVFNKRKVQKTFASIAPGKRAPSPPSPASFTSRDAVKFHVADSNSVLVREPTPQVQLDLNYRGSYSDWFPADLIGSGARTPPERNVSLQRAETGPASINNTTLVDSHWGTPEVSFTSSVDDIIIIEPVGHTSREVRLLLRVSCMAI